MRTVKYASFWSSVGIGMTFAAKLGFECVLASEYDSERCEWFKHSYKTAEMIPGDFTDPKVFDRLIKAFKEKKCELAIFSPNCQSFSLAGGQHLYTPEAFYILNIIDFIKKAEPKWFWIENAHEFLHSKLPGYTKTIKEIIETELADYNLNMDCSQDAADYGCPQHRRRSIILGSKIGVWKFPKKKPKQKSAYKAIGKLTSISAGEWSNEAFHFRPWLPQCQIDCIHDVPAGSYAANPVDKNGKLFRNKKPKYTFARIKMSKPAPTILQASDLITGYTTLHYKDDGVLSIAEIIALTGLPKNWDIPVWARCQYKLIRNVLGECMMPNYCNMLLSMLRKIIPE